MHVDRRPSVVMLLPDLPMPASTGGQVRAFHFLQGLVEIADVTACILPGRQQGSLPDEIRKKCHRILQPESPPKNGPVLRTNAIWRALTMLLTPCREHGRSLMVAGSSLCAGRAERSQLRFLHRLYAAILTMIASFVGRICDIYPSDVQFRSEGLDQLLPEILRICEKQSPDIIWCEHSYMYPVAEDLRRQFPAVMVVVNTHNVETQLKQSIASTMKSGAGRAWMELESRNLRHWERRMLRHADLVYCCSAQDAGRFRELSSNPVAKLVVVANGVDTRHFQVLPAATGTPTLLFMGTAGYPPNDDAVHWLVKEILPLVQSQLPGIRVILAGRNASQHWEQYVHENSRLEVASDVPDMRPWLEQATVCVVPIRSGSGTRLKILEAMSCGRPVVSTTLGAEGADVVDGKHLLLADHPAAFADAVVRLLDDKRMQDQLARTGRQLVVNHYDWEALIARAVHELRVTAGDRFEPLTCGAGIS